MKKSEQENKEIRRFNDGTKQSIIQIRAQILKMQNATDSSQKKKTGF